MHSATWSRHFRGCESTFSNRPSDPKNLVCAASQLAARSVIGIRFTSGNGVGEAARAALSIGRNWFFAKIAWAWSVSRNE